MLRAVSLAAALVAAIAISIGSPARALGGAPVAPVIGGSNAPAGMWPAVSCVIYGSASDPAASNNDPVDDCLCTGVLVAPTVVLTAGHCVPGVDGSGADYIGDLTGVLIGAESLADPSGGQTIVASNSDISQYPNSQQSIDIGIIKLETTATAMPSPIATGWARADIQNAAAVEFVGFGSIDENGNTYIPQLQEAPSTITDFDCSMSSGCNTLAKPDGELGAGGSGIDTCPGDSGGPMYLLTSYGTFVAGITSRGYDTDTHACGMGGIYERPDKIVDYIEATTGVKVSRGPEPTADAIAVQAGGLGTTAIAANDPKTGSHTFAVTTQPAQGSAAVDDSGNVRVCAAAAATGSDSVIVTITDSANATRSVAMTIPIAVVGATSGPCDLAASDGGGCCDAGSSPAGSLALAAVAGLALVRRRRRP